MYSFVLNVSSVVQEEVLSCAGLLPFLVAKQRQHPPNSRLVLQRANDSAGEIIPIRLQ